MSRPEVHDDSSPAASVEPVEGDDRRELEWLRRMEPEYRVTLQALAVLTERYLKATGQSQVLISDQEMHNAPDFIGQRDDGRGRISLTVSR